MGRKMKDSGIEWIGEIPADWILAELKFFAYVNNGREIHTEVKESEENAVPVYGSGGVFKYTDDVLYEGETVMFGRKGTLGKPIYVNEKFWVVDTMYYLTYSDKLMAKFNYYQLIAFDWNPYITQTALPSVVASQIMACKFPFPSVEEQWKICRKLDSIIEKLDYSYHKIEMAISAYKSIKQSLIIHAVTKGIRGEREMKDSGSQWFGRIPREWQMMRMKYLFHIQKDIAGEEGHTVLSITQRGIKIKDLSKNEGQLAADYSNYQLVHKGDFAMNHMDLLTGWVDISEYEGVTSPDYRVFVLEDKEQNYDKYYLYMMQMCYTNRIFYGLGQGVSGLGRWRLQADKFLNFEVPVPSCGEQREIAAYLDEKCSAIDTLIAKKEQLLSELETYKKSLIYEYVTGKREVPA